MTGGALQFQKWAVCNPDAEQNFAHPQFISEETNDPRRKTD